MRFRKSIKVGKGTRINLSRSGIGLSTGVKGARVSVNSKGTRTTLSAPGTGISYTSYKSHGNRKRTYRNSEKNHAGSSVNSEIGYSSYENNEAIFLRGKYHSKLLVSIILILSLLIMIGNRGVGLVFLGFGLYFLAKSRTDASKAYKFYNKALKTKENAKKIELLKTAKEIDSNNTLVNYYLAHLSFENGDNNKTLEYINDMKDRNGIDEQEFTRIYVISLFENKEYQKVIDKLESNMETDLASKLLVALAYKESGQVKKASEILATGPVNKRTYDNMVLTFKYQLGLCYLEMGDKTKAKRQLEKVYEVDSSFEDIVQYAQELEFAMGEHVKW